MRQDVAADNGAPTQHTPASLRMRIAELGIRQHRVAAQLDISDGHLSKILHGQRAADLAKVAEAIERAAAE